MKAQTMGQLEEWEHWRRTGSTGEEQRSWVDQEEVVDVEKNRE